MSEIHLPESSGTPTPPPPGKDPAAGSLLLGFALAWLITIGGYIVLFGLLSAISTIFNPGALAFAGLLVAIAPIAAVIGTAVRLLSSGRRRTAIGLFLGLGSMVAIGILLVAACFGLMVSSWGH